jgi:hypothetical protein
VIGVEVLRNTLLLSPRKQPPFGRRRARLPLRHKALSDFEIRVAQDAASETPLGRIRPSVDISIAQSWVVVHRHLGSRPQLSVFLEAGVEAVDYSPLASSGSGADLGAATSMIVVLLL